MKATGQVHDHETTLNPMHSHLVCWKSVFSGVVIALMGMLLLSALGAAIGGFTAEGLVSEEEGATALASGAGLYLGLSILASLFCGSYFAVRISRFRTTRVGAAHGMLIASLFFGLAVMGAGKAASGVSQALGKLGQGVVSSAEGVSQNPMIQDTVQKALGNSQLKSSSDQVTQGLIMRLTSGDTDGAKDYLMYQTGMSQADVDAKFAQLQTSFKDTAKKVGEKTAKAMGEGGIALFLLFFVGLLAATIGGRVASRMNVTRPFAS